MQGNNRNPVIILVGAGSRVFGFNMCTDICQTPALKGAEIRLVDINEERLHKIQKLFERVSAVTEMDLRISAYTDRTEALPGADFVILSVAHERIDRWEKDLQISRRYGIVEVQGECGGPGGLSLTLRNIPLVLDIAADIERLAPRATVLNFCNPMLRVCLAMSRYTKLRCVGLCHGLDSTQRKLSKAMGRPLILKGYGINHFNWVYQATWEDTGEDAWPDLIKYLQSGADSSRLYTSDLYEVFGRMVTPDDTHITDFLHHWRGTKDGLNARYALKPKDMEPYRAADEEWEKRIDAYISGVRDPMKDVHGLSGEGAIPIMAAMSGLTPPYTEIAVNLPNKGYIPNLREGAIVEVPARVGVNYIEGEKMGELPLALRSLISRQLDIAELAVEAAVEGSYLKALQALAIDPIVTDLGVAKSYLRDILKAHADLLPRFN